MAEKQIVRITCDVKDLIAPEKLTPLQGDLKWLEDKQYEKLKASLLRHGFCFPAFVWKHGRKTYVIDAHQRVRALQKMREEGIELDGGKVPVVYVKARDEKDAKEKIAAAMSEYGRYDEDSIYKFIKEGELEWADVKLFSDFASLNMGKLEKGWFDTDFQPPDIPDVDEPRDGFTQQTFIFRTDFLGMLEKAIEKAIDELPEHVSGHPRGEAITLMVKGFLGKS